MIQYDTTEPNATATISVEIDLSLPITQDLINIVEGKLRVIESQINQLNTRCDILIKQIRALSNTYNSLSYEERKKAEVKITKLCINYEVTTVKIWALNFQYADTNDRLEKLKSDKKIFINNLI